MRSLHKKLFRDLWRVRSQAVAIMLVFASGIALFVLSRGAFSSLRLTQQVYYRDAAFADVFARAKRAPLRLEERIRELAGVRETETRVVVEVTLDVPGLEEPASGRLVSVPDQGTPLLNRVFLRRGRWLDPARPQEVLASEAFVDANGLVVGDRVAAVINGRREELVIVGVALSPEYIYSIRPGELFPDPRRFAVLWMARQPLSAAFDMEGGFNDVTLTLAPGALEAEAIAGLDRLLQPYGGTGAIPRAQQVSHWYLEGELGQLQNMGTMLPTIFLGVAVLLVNIVLRRTVSVQREQIAQLKALGYSNGDIAAHYSQWALVVSLGGAVVGIIAGAWMGNGILGIYRDYFRFPVLAYDWSLRNIALALLVAGLAAAGGALGAVRQAVKLPPAEAMRPQAPDRYRATWIERLGAGRWMRAPSRMIVRNVARRPGRTFASIVGIAFAGAIVVMGNAMMDAIDRLMDIQFGQVQRQDVTVTFNEPVSSRAVFELRRYPGVLRVETMRAVPATIRAGSRSRQVGITGLESDPRLMRIYSGDRGALPPPRDGLLMSEKLAELLAVVPGGAVEVEVLEGRRPRLVVPVVGTVEDFTGTSAWMEIRALQRLLQEGGALSAAALSIDTTAAPELLRRLKLTPAVAGVALQQAVVDNFETYLAENMGVFLGMLFFFALVIAFGVIYNTARISLSERSRELASLRVMGFRRAEISYILLGELALLTLLALPAAMALGYGLLAMMASSLDTELYRIPVVVSARSQAIACVVVAASAVISGLVVRRRLDRLDLIGVLKTRE
ncbi:MAG TPA: FtsX-like permease family protein [Thermoanaerobaculia bacterium]|nr:FtsX-like permease family protein [Thermoanaerobaculia bacterium]